MLLILNQFVAAKLGVGEELQGIMLRVVERAGNADSEIQRQGHQGLRRSRASLGAIRSISMPA